MIQDIKDNKYGLLTVIEYTGEKSSSGNAKWKCLCECGNTIVATAGDLKTGHIKSCGCLLKNIHKRTNEYDLSGTYGIGYFRSTKGEFYFDKEDFNKIKEFCWRRTGGYVKTSVNINGSHKDIHMHRLILGINNPKIIIDHVNGCKNDNRKCNLRIATPSQNSINKGKNKNNTTGYKGVSPNGKGYMARIKKDGRTYYLGTYSTAKEASEARNRVEHEMFLDFAYKKEGGI